MDAKAFFFGKTGIIIIISLELSEQRWGEENAFFGRNSADLNPAQVARLVRGQIVLSHKGADAISACLGKKVLKWNFFLIEKKAALSAAGMQSAPSP